MNIRLMQPEDIPAVARWVADMPLWRRYGVTLESASAQFAEALQHGDLVLVAEAPGAPTGAPTGDLCGFAWCLLGGAFGRSDYLRLIGVRGDCAGQGIGAALLSAVEARATTHDLILLVSDFNAGAQRFYRRMGYEQIGAIPGYVLPDVTELIFRKRLDSQS
jgi:ribosomal protein S18 acetylase RimI-like enzyme